MNFIKKYKLFFNLLLFILIAGLTAYAIFYGNDVNALLDGLTQVSPIWIGVCVVAAVLFVFIESIIFAMLLKEKGGKLKILSCVKYSLIGYFYSAITPSSTGGQPAQLFYMIRDGHKSSKSTVALLTMAFYYKLVMVLFGLFLLIFWLPQISIFFGSYIWVYYLGLTLNIITLAVILSFMFTPNQAKWLIKKGEALLMRIKIFKPNPEREAKIDAFIDQYKESVKYLFANKLQILLYTLLTFVQRSLLMIMPVFLYLGLPLENASLLNIFFVQAAIYVAVDMLPIPGAQGITELIFVQALSAIFTAQYITASMVLTRGISFYIILLAGLIPVIYSSLFGKKMAEKMRLLNEKI